VTTISHISSSSFVSCELSPTKLLVLWGVEEETHDDDDDDDDMHCKLMSCYSSVEPPFLAVEDWWILFFL
jgi:hypothetical protein